jgi:four helix bundle protein
VEMKIERFEDIRAWQEGRILTKMVFQATSTGFFKSRRLKEQIEGSAISTMANIAEGFDSQSDSEFIKFLIYSRRSASEVQSHLYAALDQGYITKAQFDEIYEKAVLFKNLISGFIRYLKGDK